MLPGEMIQDVRDELANVDWRVVSECISGSASPSTVIALQALQNVAIHAGLDGGTVFGIRYYAYKVGVRLVISGNVTAASKQDAEMHALSIATGQFRDDLLDLCERHALHGIVEVEVPEATIT